MPEEVSAFLNDSNVNNINNQENLNKSDTDMNDAEVKNTNFLIKD